MGEMFRLKASRGLLLCVGAAVAISASNDDQSTFDFVEWLEKDVKEAYTTMAEVKEAVKRQSLRMSEAELETSFPAVSRVLLMLASQSYAKGENEDALELLDVHWELMERLEGAFKFPAQMIGALSLESEIHASNSDMKGMVRCNGILWKLLKKYHWIGGSKEMESLRIRLSSSLALSSAMDGDCLASEYFLGDAVQFARESVVLTRNTSERAAATTALTISRLLRASLNSYFYLKLSNKDSKCRYAFKRSAKAVYDVVFAIDPKLLPHWRDLKKKIKHEMKTKFDDETQQLGVYEEMQKMYNNSQQQGNLNEAAK